MLGFKDYLQQDMDTFINPDEFADSITINGASVVAVVDNDKLQYRISKDNAGLITGDKLIFISSAEYDKIPKAGHPPKVGDALLFNSKPVTITDVADDCGVYEIILQTAGR